MSEPINKLTRKLFSNSRMELEFFMYLPTGCNTGQSTLALNCNPVIYLRFKNNKSFVQEYDYAKASYKITPRNLYHIIKFFNKIMKWFYDDEFSDLFLLNENNDIIFNADYNKLSESTPRSDYDSSIMQAIPTVIRLGDKPYEGIHLYVNSSTYCIPLSFQEISILFGILKDIRFTNEVTNAIISYEYIKNNNAYVSKDSMNKKTPFDL